jgi:hypothetical protein
MPSLVKKTHNHSSSFVGSSVSIVIGVRAGRSGFDSQQEQGFFFFSLPHAEIKNAWNYTSISPYVFMAWYLVKHKDNFTLFFLV